MFCMRRRDFSAATLYDFQKSGSRTAFVANGTSELTDAQRAAYAVTVAADAERLADAAATEAKAALSAANTRIHTNTWQTYYTHASIAAAQVRMGTARADEAVRRAVKSMAVNGIKYSEYERSDGRVVQVPVDVGVRREIQTASCQRLEKQVLDIAEMLGENLVEVSSHMGARPSHAKWHGRVYMLNGSSEKYKNYYEATKAVGGPYADWVNGFGGYNCHHTLRIFHEGEQQRWSPHPEEGTGYTNDEIYKLRQKQRALENDIRKTKRQADMLEGAKMDASAERAIIRQDQKQLRELIGENSKVLSREPWREQVVNTAGITRRTPAPTPGMPGGVRAVSGTLTIPKRPVVAGSPMVAETANAVSEAARAVGNGLPATVVDLASIESKRYRKRIKQAVGSSAAEGAFDAAKRILRHRSGTEFEDLCIIRTRDGKVLASVTDSTSIMGIAPNATAYAVMAQARSDGEGFFIMHNHPHSSAPSGTDINLLIQQGADFGVVVAHDGSVFKFSIVGDAREGYNHLSAQGEYNKWTKQGLDEAAVSQMVLEQTGVKIEHFT